MYLGDDDVLEHVVERPVPQLVRQHRQDLRSVAALLPLLLLLGRLLLAQLRALLGCNSINIFLSDFLHISAF